MPKHKVDMVWRYQMASAPGNDWKLVRSTFSSIFTSGKLKSMLPIIEVVADKLVQCFEMDVGKEVELKDKFGKYSMDVIASAAFGVDAGSFANQDEGSSTLFLHYAGSIFKRNKWDTMKVFLVLIPWLGWRILGALGKPMGKQEETEFFIDVIEEVRNDVIILQGCY